MKNYKFDHFPELTTDRLRLREITLSDSQSLFEILSHTEVVKYDTFDRFTDIKQAVQLIDLFNRRFREEKAIFWGITFKDEDVLIGFCKCEIEEPGVRADFGYDLNFEYWNRGIMTETIKTVMDFTIKQLDIKRLGATVSIENIASVKVLRKCGFIEDELVKSHEKLKLSYT